MNEFFHTLSDDILIHSISDPSSGISKSWPVQKHL
ncbi:MAG: hypothetical protein HW373_521 [Deltaproteobacteria bacterium]|nr:hypothetical protein [Deltaproteobacteria bacterium]